MMKATWWLVLFYLQTGIAGASERMQVTIGTGPLTGVSYSVGSAVAKVVKGYGESPIRAERTAGPVDNIALVTSGKVSFGIAPSSLLYQARQGLGPWEGNPQRELRAVLGLHSEDVTLVAAANAGISSLKDLKGKRVNAGAPGSSDQIIFRLLLQLAGLDIRRDITLVQEPVTTSPRLLREGVVDAYLYTVGHPNLSLFEALSGERKVTIVPIDREIVEDLTASSPYLSEDQIPIDYYREVGLQNDAPVPTVAVRAILFARADADEALVYRVVRRVLEELALFRRQHPVLARLALNEMATMRALPLHPAAGRYFREQSLLP